MIQYRNEISELSGDELLVKIDADGKEFWIPTDPANSDYQRYLRWLENPDADESGTL